MRRLLATTFALAFAFGALGAVLYMHRVVHETTHTDAVIETDKSDDGADADDKAAVNKWPDDAGTPEQVLYAQGQLMQDAVNTLMSRTPGKPNLYLIGFAGDGDGNVFRNEVEFVERQFSQRFDSAGHTIALINNPATITRLPIASLSNLQTAVDGAAARMDGNEDILFLFLTSHGSKDHELYVGLDPLPLDQISPEDLSDLFSDTRIRYRVIVISACYSGGFIDALRNDTTLVITAASADRTSFGCGTDSDITDFGRAFFVDGLNHNDSFQAAFDEAKNLIDSWETRDDETHSLPQMVSTPKIEAQLKLWRAGIRLGAPLPFKAAPTPPTDTKSLTALR